MFFFLGHHYAWVLILLLVLLRSGSAILLAMGLPEDIARNALRFSVGRHTLKTDIDRVIKDLQQAVATLQEKANDKEET